MRSEALCVAAVLVAACIFGGNRMVVSCADCTGTLDECECFVKISRAGTYTSATCSVKYNHAPVKTASQLSDCDKVAPGTVDRIIMCDAGATAILKCRTKTITVKSGTAAQLTCTKDKTGAVDATSSQYTDWVNNVKGKGNTNKSRGFFSWLRPRAADEDVAVSTLLNPTEVLTVTSGDAGTQLDRSNSPWVTVTEGRADLVSLCSGRIARLTAPATALDNNDWTLLPLLRGELPDFDAGKCSLRDLSGTWRGGYIATNARKELELFPFTITIRGREGTVDMNGQQLAITRFDVVNEVFQPGTTSSFDMEASSAGGAAAVLIAGSVDKGNMRISLTSTNGPYFAGSGSMHRLYIAQSALPKAAAGAAYRHQLYAGSTAADRIAWSIADGALPAGVSLDPNVGTLSGTPGSAGDYKFTVRVSDSNGDVFLQPLTLEVKRMILASDIVPAAFVGQPYSYRLEIVGGKPPYTFTDDLYAGFSLPGFPRLSSDGTITLDPPVTTASQNILFTVKDSSGLSEPLGVTFPVRGITLMASQKLPDAAPGKPYEYTFQAIGTAASVSWEISWDLQGTGLVFDKATGKLSGTPVSETDLSFDVTARAGSDSHTRQFDLSVGSGVVTQAMARRTTGPSRAVGRRGHLE